VISGDAVSLIRAAGQAENALGRVGQTGQRAAEQSTSFIDKLKSAASTAGIVTGFAAVAASIKFVATEGMAFEDAMNGFKGVTNASASTMAAASAKAQALGSDLTLPATSAGDAAGAMLELAKGGMSAGQAMEATRGTLLLAAAASISGAEAATIQSNAINSFSLSADKAGHVADVLANTANAASGSVQDVGAAMSTVGGVANQMGISIEDTATALGIFAQNGRTGAEGGTLLRGVITSLQNQSAPAKKAMEALGLTVYDNQGKFVGLASITDQLAQAQGSMSQEAFNAATNQLFGNEAMSGAGYLAKAAADGYQEMGDKVRAADGAQRAATVATEGLSGAFDGFMSAAGGAAVTLYTAVSPALQGAVGFATDLATAVGGMISWFTQLPAPIQAGTTALAALILLKGPLAALWASMMASGVGLAIQGEMLAARLAVQSLRLEAAASGTSMGLLGAGMRVAGIAAVGLGRSLKAAFMSNPIGLALVAATTALTFFISASDDAAGSTADFTGAIDENTGALSKNAPAVIASASAKSGAFAAYKAIGGSVKEYTDALLGNTSAQDELHTRLLDTAEATLKSSAAWKDAVSKGLELSKNSRQVASDILATGDAGKYASEGFDKVLNSSRMYSDESGKLGTEAEQTNDVLTATGGATDKAAGGLDKTGGAAATASSAMDSFKRATDGLTASASLADAAMQFLQADLDAASGHAISMEQATRLSDAAFRGIKVAADDYAAAQDNVTAAAIKVREAQAKVDDVTKNLGKSQADGGTTADDLTTAQLALADANRANEEATGKVTDATDKQFDANIQARDGALKVATALYTNTAATKGVDAATQAATASLQTAKDAFIAAQPEADRLSGKANKTADALFGIPKDTVAKIAETGAATVQGQAGAVKGAIDAIPGSKVISINAETGVAIREIGNLQQVINSVTGKSVTFTTNNVVNNIVRGTTIATPYAGGSINDYVSAAKTKAAGFWGGGKLPGTPPADPTVDNIPAVGPGGTPFRVRSNEWVISEPASKYYGDDRMAAINDMTYPRLSPGAGTMSSAGGSQPINLTLTLVGDGPITEAALGAAQVTVDGAMRDFALSVVRQAGQGI
jgi:TP901 family phage tail tape measure protein